MNTTQIHPCACRSYNGGQCYNCLNGAHNLCDAGCKTEPAKTPGVVIKVKRTRKPAAEYWRGRFEGLKMLCAELASDCEGVAKVSETKAEQRTWKMIASRLRAATK